MYLQLRSYEFHGCEIFYCLTCPKKEFTRARTSVMVCNLETYDLSCLFIFVIQSYAQSRAGGYGIVLISHKYVYL